MEPELSLLIVFAAGLLSFLSPCVLPLPSIANPGHLNIGIDWDSESSIQNLYYRL
jgi:hypothetical protein